MIQIWIAYPDDFLFRPLKYQDIKKENISEVNGDGFKLRLIKDENVEIADISNPNLNTQKIIHGIIEAGKFVNIDIPNNFNACLYIIDGEIKIMGENIESRKLVWFNNDGENIRINAISNSQFLLLSGESLEKTLAQYYSEITN
ncbi:MAG: pirin-like C-terminal cupin domain-containing protein [Candidatus Sericytochromatia bacterium]